MSYEAGGRRDGRTHSTPYHQRAPPDSEQHDMQGRQAKAEAGFAAGADVWVLQARLCKCRNCAAATGATPRFPTGSKKEKKGGREERKRREEERIEEEVEADRGEKRQGKRGRKEERLPGKVGEGCWRRERAG